MEALEAQILSNKMDFTYSLTGRLSLSALAFRLFCLPMSLHSIIHSVRTNDCDMTVAWRWKGDGFAYRP